MSAVIEAHKRRVGERIRFARRHAGLSHDALAAVVGTSRQHLIKLERGQHLPRPAMLARIADATGRDELWFESEDDEEGEPAVSLDEFLRRRIHQLVREEMQA